MNKYNSTRATESPGLAFLFGQPVIFLAVIFSLSCVAESQAFQAQTTDARVIQSTGTTMGPVPFNVLAWKSSGPEDISQEKIDAAVADELEFVNQAMSTYIETSEISRFNASDSTQWFSVSSATVAVVERAQQISEATDGAFDITVHPLVQLWKFGTDKENPRVPTQIEIDSVLAKIGYQKLATRSDPPAIRKSIPELKIDLSAIAKGYAVDRVAERLNRLGIDNYMVEVGGEVRAAGEKPSKTGWRIGIEKPVAGERIPFKIVELFHKSLASSGDYRNFYEIDGKRYSHTIDPRTGRPVEHGVSAASVISNDCMTADAIATAIMVLGSEGGLRVAKENKAAAIVMTRSGSQVHSQQTEDFAAYLRAPSIKANNPKEASVFRMIAVASVIFLLAVIGMAVGVIVSGKKLKGSCGGIAALDNPDVTPECSLCSLAAECSDLKNELEKRTTDPK